MLQFVFGRTGTGKTTRILEQALARAKEGGRTLILVPEQSSFAMQLRVAKAVRGAAAGNIEVLDFSRTAANIFRVCGGGAGRRLDDVSRCVIMRLACDAAGGDLAVYGRQCKTPAFLSTAIAAVEEFKQEGFYPETLREVAGRLPDAPLRAKLGDLALLYDAYQKILERSYCDPLDDLRKATELARHTDFFRGCGIFVDGFARFGAPEMRMLETMAEQADCLTVALTADGAEETDSDIFTDQKQTARRLSAHARAAGITVAQPAVLETQYRLQSPGLRLAERLCAAGRYERVQPTADPNLRILTAADRYEELRYAAAEICRLLREEHLRYRDIAVICREADDYRGAAETIFAEYGIPIFLDRKDSVLAQPLIATVLRALEACRGRWKTEAILALTRSPALGIAQNAAGELENYCYVWSVRGEDWLSPFQKSPEGMTDQPERGAEAVAAIEATRQQVMEPLLRLREQATAGDGIRFCRGIYDYIEEIRAFDNLTAASAGMADLAAQDNDRVWNCVVDVLDLFSDLIPDRKYSVSGFIDLFTLAIAATKLGSVPNTRDSLVVGSANRIRLDSPKAVFVLGLNEGEFPAVAKPGGVFSERERDALSAGGMELGVTGARRALRERFCLYSALTASAGLLYLSNHAGDLRGGKAKPCAMLRRLSALLPESCISIAELPRYGFVAGMPSAKSTYAFAVGMGDGAAATLAALLMQKGEERFLREIDFAAAQQPAEPISPATARRLTGDRLSLSATEIEHFYQCPYSYFCERMLRLAPRRRVEYSSLSSGNTVHFVLEQLLKRHGGQGLAALSAQALRDELSELLHAYILEQVGGEDRISPKFRCQLDRLTVVLQYIVRHLAQDFAQSSFQVAATETRIGPGEPIEGAPLCTADGTPIILRGKIDRIDTWQAPDGSYARVIDYKTGNKEFRLSEVLYGLNMQMLLYLFALCGDAGTAFGKQRPAGVLYMPGRVKPSDSEQDLAKTLRMSGLLLDEEPVLRAMEKDLAGRYIPVVEKPAGGYKKDCVISMEEMERQRELVYRNITELGNALRGGEIAPMPVRDSRNDPCGYCKYGALCRNREGAQYKDLSGKGGREDGGELD